MIVAANLKTNLTRAKTAAYLERLEACISEQEFTQQVMVFPAMTALDTHKGAITVGAQNAYPAANGAYTGEIGLDQLDEFGIKTVLIGHSERRHVLGEEQELIVQKYDYFKSLGFTIVYCIGEPLEVREAGSEPLMRYLDAQLEGIDLNYEKLVIAYEPVWAIGTGVTPTLSDIELLHTALKQKMHCPLLYGGSVKAENARSIMELKGVDGVLVGSASLESESFCSMIKDAQNIYRLQKGEK